MHRDVLNIGITASAFADDLRSIPQRARLLGFDGLQFDAYSSTLNIPDLPASGRREFLRLLSTQDRQLVGLRFDAGPRGFGPGADVDRVLDRLDLIMECAVGMAAPLVCIDAGPLPAPPRDVKPKPRITQDQAGIILLPSSMTEPAPLPQPPAAPPDPSLFSLADSALAELGARADRYSVILAFRSEQASFVAIARALRAANCPWFGLDLDPAAVLRDEWSMEEVFSQMGEMIRHVRGRDAVRGADRRAKPAVIGAGSTDWPLLLADLDAAGYHGWLTIDPTELTDRMAAAEAGRKRLMAIAR
jgi:sugar phosphate isomerase/epimerase